MYITALNIVQSIRVTSAPGHKISINVKALQKVPAKT